MIERHVTFRVLPNKADDLARLLRFESLDAAAAWRASSLHEELKPHLKSLCDGSELKVLEVVVQE